MTSHTKSNRHYDALLVEAVQAALRGEHRLAAYKYLEVFDAAPSEDTPGRSACLDAWLRLMTSLSKFEKYTDFDDDDAILKRISNDESEPPHARFLALMARAYIQHCRTNFTKEATYLRRGIVLAGRIGQDERARKHGPDKHGSKEISVGDVVDEWVGESRRALRSIENTSGTTVDFGAILDNHACDSVDERNNMMHEMMHRLSTAGRRCDCCQKTAEELGLDVLFKCSRCKLGFYCSRTCQAQQWAGMSGHNETCRKYGEIGAAI